MTLISLFICYCYVNCSKSDTEEKTNETTSGVVNFWTKNSAKVPMLIKINNQEKFITQVYNAQPPGCRGNEGCAFFDLPPSTYNVIVTDKNGVVTTLTHTVNPGGCIQFKIN